MDHKLFTQQGENDFAAALIGAAHTALSEGSAMMRWYEEWELERVADNDQDGLWFVTVTAAHDLSGTITEAVEAMIAAGLRKFARNRWADIQVLVLDKSSVIMEAELVAAAVSDLETTDLSALDAILLAEEDRATPVWEHAR